MNRVDYNEICKVYDDVREGDIKLINQFLKELPTGDALNILDIGCGTGNYTNLFQMITQANGYEIYGIDPSEGMLEKARQKNNHTFFKRGIAEHIPSKDNFFYFVYMTDVVHHVSDINKMFAEIRRVLTFDGRVCIVTQSHQQIEHRPIVQFFPGTARIDKDRYREIGEIIKAADHNRLRFLRQEVLCEGEEVELGLDYLELVRKKGYSMLCLLPDDEYQSRLGALEEALKHGPIQSKSAGETLVWFRKE